MKELQAYKEVYQQATSLYHQLANASESEFKSTCDRFNALIQEHDFNNEDHHGNEVLGADEIRPVNCISIIPVAFKLNGKSYPDGRIL